MDTEERESKRSRRESDSEQTPKVDGITGFKKGQRDFTPQSDPGSAICADFTSKEKEYTNGVERGRGSPDSIRANLDRVASPARGRRPPKSVRGRKFVPAKRIPEDWEEILDLVPPPPPPPVTGGEPVVSEKTHRVDWTIRRLKIDLKTLQVKYWNVFVPAGQFWPNGYYGKATKRARMRMAGAQVDSWCAVGLVMPEGTKLKFRFHIGQELRNQWSEVRTCHWQAMGSVVEQIWVPPHQARCQSRSMSFARQKRALDQFFMIENYLCFKDHKRSSLDVVCICLYVLLKPYVLQEPGNLRNLVVGVEILQDLKANPLAGRSKVLWGQSKLFDLFGDVMIVRMFEKRNQKRAADCSTKNDLCPSLSVWILGMPMS
eukprot:Skav233724  [mRNA]  locus=scaffold2839:13493:25031:+ [translate_table: standard]